MLCPTCQTEAGASEFCPKCLGQLPKPPPAPAPPADATAAAPPAAPPVPAAKAPDPRRQMIVYGGAVLLATSVGFSGAAIYEHLANPTAGTCHELCSYAEIPSVAANANLDLIPGRLTMHLYEDKIAGRWSDVYQGDPLAIRTVTKPREIAESYAKQHGYEFVIMDTSPSLGTLNKVIISTADGFLIPCMPDMFSLYGVRNIGNALTVWKKQFDTIYQLLSTEKRKAFPANYVRLLGFTIYNAKKYSGGTWDLAKAHYNYAQQIPGAINRFIPLSVREHLQEDILSRPVGQTAIMHTHNTLPSMAQRYHLPMWKVPSCSHLEGSDVGTIAGNRSVYEGTRAKYIEFADDLLKRLGSLS